MNIKIITKIAGLIVLPAIMFACAEYPQRESSADGIEVGTGMESVAGDAVTEPADMNRDLQTPVAMSSHSGEDVQALIAEAQENIERSDGMGGLWVGTDKKLKEAKANYNKGDFDGAWELASAVNDESKMSYNQSLLELAHHMVERVKGLDAEMTPEMEEKIISANNAYESGDGELAYETGTVLMAEAMDMAGGMAGMKLAEMDDVPEIADEPAMDESMAMEDPVFEEKEPVQEQTVAAVREEALGANAGDKPGEYEVVKGDSLWKISSKPKIYSDPYQWPLIYKSNQDKIQDPDVIHPGQNLDINRQASDREVKMAVQHAKTRGAWSLADKEEADRKYLLKSKNSGVASR